MKKIRHTILLALLTLTSLGSHAATGLEGLFAETYEGKADTLTYCLLNRFLNQAKGTFYAVPIDNSNRVSASTYIYWQQAHAMDVVVYAYERIKDTNPTLASNYKKMMENWYKNHANNWYHDSSDKTGFLNEYTDDMCWICLTLIHISEALGDEKYINTAKTVFDLYIEPRGWEDKDGYWGLPWTSNNSERNACTNAPGCLVAAKLYQYYGEEHYLDVAKNIYNFWEHEMTTKLGNDGRVEEPPLTYTQGTFGEAARRLFNITNNMNYMTMAQKVIWYACSSGRCVDKGILRHEGTSMDQSIFKAVLIPYAVNLVLDEGCRPTYKNNIAKFLIKNADTLWENLLLEEYPKTYCNYYWGTPINPDDVPSMGAMASGASLMENVARMALGILGPNGIKGVAGEQSSNTNVYDTNGRLVMSDASHISLLRPGTYVVNGRKVIIK